MATPSISTPPPKYDADDRTGVRPPPMDDPEKRRIRTAAGIATRRYPGPVGELIARELHAWADFGYRVGYGSNALITRVADMLLLHEDAL